MKEENVMIVLDVLLKKHDSCTLAAVYRGVQEYMKKHPDTYIDGSSDTLDYYLDAYPEKYYWDYKSELIHKQVNLKCPLCGVVHRKYPKQEEFMKIERKKAKIGG